MPSFSVLLLMLFEWKSIKKKERKEIEVGLIRLERGKVVKHAVCLIDKEQGRVRVVRKTGLDYISTEGFMDSETQPWGIQVERRRAACPWRCIRHDYHMQLDRISRSVTVLR